MRWTNGLKHNVDGTQCRRQRVSSNKAAVANTDVQQVVNDLASCGTACKVKEHKSRIYCNKLRLQAIYISVRDTIRCQIKIYCWYGIAQLKLNTPAKTEKKSLCM